MSFNDRLSISRFLRTETEEDIGDSTKFFMISYISKRKGLTKSFLDLKNKQGAIPLMNYFEFKQNHL